MRKYIAVIILLIFIFDIGGYYLWYSLLQKNIQRDVNREIEMGINDEDLSLIIVPVNNESGICWIKQDKEFRYQGDMYDVVKIKTIDKKKYYYCINDTREKQLVDNFNKNNNSKKSAEKKIRQSFNYQYLPQPFGRKIYFKCTDCLYPAPVFLFKSNKAEIHSPPPRSV
ncbi:MAG: hypothetical protein NTV01_15420 [Bacteroidia bacterium]|nr:hypothetical protein [Bacteroidia bacterium]